MKVFLIRHTTPQIEKGICYGQTDLELSDTFEVELQAVKTILPQHAELPLFSSPLQRCLKLAHALNQKQTVIDKRILELNFGDWEMKRWEDIEKKELDFWMNNVVHEAPPKGEAHIQVYQRSIDFWNEILQTEQEQIGIVTHYGVIQALLAHLLHIPLDKSFRLDISYGGVIQINIMENTYYKIKFLK